MDYSKAFDYANRFKIVNDLMMNGRGSNLTKAIAESWEWGGGGACVCMCVCVWRGGGRGCMCVYVVWWWWWWGGGGELLVLVWVVVGCFTSFGIYGHIVLSLLPIPIYCFSFTFTSDLYISRICISVYLHNFVI